MRSRRSSPPLSRAFECMVKDRGLRHRDHQRRKTPRPRIFFALTKCNIAILLRAKIHASPRAQRLPCATGSCPCSVNSRCPQASSSCPVPPHDAPKASLGSSPHECEQPLFGRSGLKPTRIWPAYSGSHFGGHVVLNFRGGLRSALTEDLSVTMACPPSASPKSRTRTSCRSARGYGASTSESRRNRCGAANFRPVPKAAVSKRNKMREQKAWKSFSPDQPV
jgi:hypothetical protein